MKRPYYRKPQISLTTSASQSSSLPILRERILNGMLLGTTLFGLVALILNLSSDIPRGNWGIIIVYALAYLSIVVLTFVKKLPYKVRAIGFEVAVFLLAIVATLTDGIAGNGRVWFLGFVALGGILLGLNSGIHALILGSLTYLLIGGLMVGGFIKAPQASSLPSASVFMDWVNTGVVYVMVALTIVITLTVLIRDLAGSLEKEHKLLDELNKDKEEIDQRTTELDRRLVQIRTAAEISRSISAVLEPSVLLQQVVDVVRERFGLYYVGVFLVDERDDYAVLQAGTGDVGQRMIAEGHKLPVGGTSMIGWAIAHRQARIALDTGKETDRFSNPLLPKTRSEAALPIRGGDQVYGAISVQSSKPKAFDEDDVVVLQGIADSLGTALQNARLFQQDQKNLEEIQALNRQYMLDAWTGVAARPEVSSYSYPDAQRADEKTASSAIRVPIALREQVIGQVSLELNTNELSGTDRTFIEQVTNQAALAMENVRLLEETQRHSRREHLVAEIVRKARASSDVDSIIRTTLGELGKSLNAIEGVFHLRVDENKSVPQNNRGEL